MFCCTCIFLVLSVSVPSEENTQPQLAYITAFTHSIGEVQAENCIKAKKPHGKLFIQK